MIYCVHLQIKRQVYQSRWQVTIVIPFLPGKNITIPTVWKGKRFSPRGVISHYPYENFISFSNRPRGIFANASKCQQSQTFSYFLPQKVITEFVGSFSFFLSCSALELRIPGSIQYIRSIRSTELIASINTKTINMIDLIYWHCRHPQPNCKTLVSFFDLTDWLKLLSIVVLHPVSSC